MNRKMGKIKPAVNKHVLLLLAGLMWLSVGVVLLYVSYTWLHASRGYDAYVFGGIGVVIALIVHHFGFLKIVDKNLGRILPMEGTRCVFSFITWKSYILISIMIMFGLLLRHSPIPKLYLSVIYIAIGVALLLSSIRYLRYSFLLINNKL